MKNKISSKVGIFIIVSLSAFILLIIAFNVLDLKLSIFKEENLDFDVVDFLSDEVYCDMLHNEILLLAEEINFCEEDDDCKAFPLNEENIGTDCYFYANKDVDKNIFHEKLLDYKKRCDIKNIDCELYSDLVCINNTCVYVDSN